MTTQTEPDSIPMNAPELVVFWLTLAVAALSIVVLSFQIFPTTLQAFYGANLFVIAGVWPQLLMRFHQKENMKGVILTVFSFPVVLGVSIYGAFAPFFL